MNRLFVYGDSFTAPHSHLTTWPKLVASKLNFALYNRSVAGSSAEFSFRNLLEDVKTKNLDNDVVIYVPSHPGRLHFQFQMNRPETAANYMHDPNKTLDGDHKWYWENKDYIEWWLVNYDHNILEMNHRAYIEWLKIIATEYPSSEFLVLNAFEDKYDWASKTFPKNFIHPNINLAQISKDELDVGDDFDYFEWVKHTRYEARANHLIKPNIEKLANIITSIVQDKDTTKLSYDIFERRAVKPIKHIKDYMNYVEQGILDLDPAIFEYLTSK